MAPPAHSSSAADTGDAGDRASESAASTATAVVPERIANMGNAAREPRSEGVTQERGGLCLDDVNEHGIPMLPEEDSPLSSSTDLPDPLDHCHEDNGWSDWDAKRSYEIERVVSAQRKGSGWSLMVKWKGYPIPTPESLSTILQQTNHPDILKEIDQCKQDYYALNPSSDPTTEGMEEGDQKRPEPTRVLPTRTRSKPDHFVYSVRAHSPWSPQTRAGTIRCVRKKLSLSNQAKSLLMADRLT